MRAALPGELRCTGWPDVEVLEVLGARGLQQRRNVQRVRAQTSPWRGTVDLSEENHPASPFKLDESGAAQALGSFQEQRSTFWGLTVTLKHSIPSGLGHPALTSIQSIAGPLQRVQLLPPLELWNTRKLIC